MTSAKKPSARAARRDLARKDAKFARDVERLAQLQPGGSPANPWEVASASLVDPRAESTPCPLCQGKLRLDEHVAQEFAGRRLRVAKMLCSMCGTRRALYFRVGSALPS